MTKSRTIRALLSVAAGALLTLAGRTSAAQSSTADTARTVDAGTVVRIVTDTNQFDGRLGSMLIPARDSLLFLSSCSRCHVSQYPLASVRSLNMRVGASRATHVGLGFLIGAGIGAAAGAVEGASLTIEGAPIGAPGAVAGGVIIGALGGILGAVVGAILPVNYRWEPVPVGH
ncbi:MAG: hypothetical protein M3R65_05740 [Gemmatimonadota bacterium]|nr:hypothetical protein [Gemmatimonadota bacterium]